MLLAGLSRLLPGPPNICRPMRRMHSGDIGPWKGNSPWLSIRPRPLAINHQPHLKQWPRVPPQALRSRQMNPQGQNSKAAVPQCDAVACSHTDPVSRQVRSGASASSQLSVGRAAPEVTFTPTAARLHTEDGIQTSLPFDIQTLVTETISRFIAAGAHHGTHPSALQTASYSHAPIHVDRHPDYTAIQDSVHSEDSLWNEDDHREMEFSDDEGLLPDRSPLTQLFRPSLFKSLLHKAKVTTNLASSEGQSDM